MKIVSLGAFLCSIALFFTFTTHSQTVYPHYQDGKIYLKLKDNFPLKLVMAREGTVDYNVLSKYSFVEAVAGEYGVTSMTRPFPKANGIGGDALQRTFLIKFDDHTKVDDLIRDLTSNNMVEYVEKVPLHKLTLTPNDPMHSTVWSLGVIQADLAWNISTGNSNVVVAVTDNAIQITHPDLNDAIWTNPGEIAGNGLDDDGNGYIDDVNGWDVGDDDNNPNPLNSGWDHGTHCAGTIGAETNNGIGVSSIGFGISIMPVKVTTNSASSSSVTNGYDGIYYAALTGADVISCSWGGYGYSTTGQNLVNWAWNQGSIVVGAAGNDNYNMDTGGNAHYPSNYNNVVCVASSTTSDAKSSFSNYGSAVDVTAPGSNIRSTVPNNTYAYMSGTSMATPLVSGLLGLMMSAQPGLPQQDYVDCLISSCDDISAQNPSYNGDLGGGRINAFQALNCVTAFSSNAPIADFQANFTTITAGASVQFTDLSTYNPNNWSWNFDNQSLGGVTPATANTQGPHTVTYNTPGVYEVSLTVSNGNGSDTETKTAYITVNSPAGCSQLNLDDPTFASLTSIHAGWTPSLYGTTGDGYLAGINEYGDVAKAEYFPSGMVGTSSHVVGTYVWFGAAYSGNASKTVDINVYDATGGTPGAILGTRTVTMGDIGTGGIFYYSFNPPIAVPGSAEIAVGVDMSNLNYNGGDTMGLVTNADGEASSSIGFEKWNTGTWYTYIAGWGVTSLSNYIFPDLTSAPPSISLSASATTICEGESVDFDATGSTYDDTLVWTFQGSNPVNSTNVMENAVYNNSGTYKAYLEVVGGGCGNYLVDSVTITVNPSPTIVISTPDPDICVGDGPITITASGASSYSWSPGGQTTAAISVSPTTTTTYTVTGSQGGCDGSASIQIEVGEIPVLTTSITNVDCNGASTGAIDLTVTNLVNCTYNWGAQGTNEDLSGLVAGNYNVTVTSDMGCTANGSYSVTQNTAIAVTENTANATCGASNGTVSLNITGGVSPYSENYGADNPNALAPGTHNYTVTDNVGCVYNGTYSISTTGGPSLSSTHVNVTCPGGNTGSINLTVSGGTAPYTYDWGAQGSTTEDISGLTAGTYSVDVTDNNSCVSSATVVVTQPTAFSSSPSVTNVSCNGGANGSVTLNVSGGTSPYSENWAGENPSALSAGTYPVVVTDNAGCTYNTNVTVTEPAALAATETTTNVDCNGGTDGTAFLNVTGGTSPYSENWQGENNAALGAGTYTVIITDANSCTLNYDVTITEPAALSVNTTTSDASCNGFTDGSVDMVSISGGTAPYTENWGGANIGALGAGTYNYTVTDANGCTSNGSVTITEPTALSVSGTVVDESAGNDGEVDITVSGGTPAYSYNWGAQGTSEDLTGLAAGTYTVTITDANGCSIQDSYTVNDFTGLDENTGITFLVYPNPVATELNIELQGEYVYHITNDLGQKIMEGNGQNDTKIDLSLYTTGIYFVKVQQGEKLFTAKVVKK
ncbi:MAG: S8 family serine peptidase [Crocinitomicaceae bacterium]|nr:S8 family serine peptidase [Crocinitomicaceae bacterium]